MGKQKISVTIILAAILVAAGYLQAAGAQSSQSSGAAHWNGPSGTYPLNLGYSSQNAIKADNVKNLQIRWVFPLPSAPAQLGVGSDGVSLTPIVVSGIVYFLTNFHVVYALDAATGNVLWTHSLGLPTLNLVAQGLAPSCCSGGSPTTQGHYHAIYYTSSLRGVPLIWVYANNYTIWAFNALNGDTNLKVNLIPYFKDNPGNFGRYDAETPTLVIDERRGIVVFGNSGSEGVDNGRGFFYGLDVTSNPVRLLWRTAIIPPQDGSNPNWAIESVSNMSYAYVFNPQTGQAIDLKSLPSTQLQQMLYNDWGNFGFNGTKSFGGATPAWGNGWALDPQTGFAYLGTAQPAPDRNASLRPGPNLWSDSIMAIDDTNGKIVWAFQEYAHDYFDLDCSWNPILANATISGQLTKVVFKTCKDGRLVALDAATGKMFWSFFAPSIKLPLSNSPRFHDPTNKTQMNTPWVAYPQTKNIPVATTVIESAPAFDPTTNTVFVVPYNSPGYWTIAPIKGPSIPWYSVANGICITLCTPGSGPKYGEVNSTVWAVDASTGQPRWHFDVGKIGFRGGVTVSAGLVYLANSDGFVRVLDEKTGNILVSTLVGSAIITQPAIAADANGQYEVIMPATKPSTTGSIGGIGLSTPGFVFALWAPTPSAVTTVTSVSTETIATQTIATETIATQTIATQLQTGVSADVFYGVVTVAVLAVIVAGVLAVRLRKHTP